MTTTEQNRRYIKFDLMIRDRFIGTIKVPTYMADGLDEGWQFIFSEETLCNYIVKKFPTLKNNPFNICF